MALAALVISVVAVLFAGSMAVETRRQRKILERQVHATEEADAREVAALPTCDVVSAVTEGSSYVFDINVRNLLGAVRHALVWFEASGGRHTDQMLVGGLATGGLAQVRVEVPVVIWNVPDVAWAIHLQCLDGTDNVREIVSTERPHAPIAFDLSRPFESDGSQPWVVDPDTGTIHIGPPDTAHFDLLAAMEDGLGAGRRYPRGLITNGVAAPLSDEARKWLPAAQAEYDRMPRQERET